VDIPGNGGLLDSAQDLKFMPGFNLEGFPNRDSTIYTKAYGINDAHTCLRGTIRYKVIETNIFENIRKYHLHST